LRTLTGLRLGAGILQPLTTSDVPVLQAVLTLSARNGYPQKQKTPLTLEATIDSGNWTQLLIGN
jgi:hypothetical protein